MAFWSRSSPAKSTSSADSKHPWYLRWLTVWSDAIRKKDFGAIVDWFVLWFMGIGLTALVLAAVAAYYGGGDSSTIPVTATLHNTGLGLRVFGLGLMLAGAATAIGWLFGLLFGIPRAAAQITDASVAAAAAAAATPGASMAATSRKIASKVNTNLEDISDWLTKTIVGVGLTQLGKLPDFVGGLALQANNYGFNWDKHGVLLAVSIMLYFTPGGFWMGYVGTRTLLTGLFDLFSGGWDDHVERSAAVDNLEIDGLNEIRPATGTVVLADAAVLSKPISELTTTGEIIAWAAAQARLGNLETARVALENALGSEPDNEIALRQLVKVYLALKRYDEARKLARALPDSPPKMLASLYDPPPGGYQLARKIGEDLMKDPQFDGAASMHVWLACAYGQEYSNLIKPKDGKTAPKPATDPDVVNVKNLVKVEITKAIALDSRMLKVLRNLWRPEKDDEIDNDLSAFADDDLRDVLGTPPAKGGAPAPVKPEPEPPAPIAPGGPRPPAEGGVPAEPAAPEAEDAAAEPPKPADNAGGQDAGG